MRQVRRLAGSKYVDGLSPAAQQKLHAILAPLVRYCDLAGFDAIPITRTRQERMEHIQNAVHTRILYQRWNPDNSTRADERIQPSVFHGRAGIIAIEDFMRHVNSYEGDSDRMSSKLISALDDGYMATFPDVADAVEHLDTMKHPSTIAHAYEEELGELFGECVNRH